jgi:hypothetical protein
MDLDNKKSPDRLLDGHFRALGDETDEKGLLCAQPSQLKQRRLLHFYNTTNSNDVEKSMMRRGAPPGREEAGVSAPAGLSTYHKSRKFEDLKPGTVTVYPQGSLLTVSKQRLNPYEGQKRDWTRDIIREFSKASRRRLMRMMAKIQKSELPQFVTLTYPAEWPADPQVWKQHLKKFIMRLKYRFPGFAGIWKLEFQKRGAPHFHLLVWGLPAAGMKKYISYHWYKVVGSEDEKHLAAGTQIQRIKSWRGVMSYASKYLGKSQENYGLPVGRFWGVFNRDGVPWSDEVVYFVTQSQIILAMRYMRRYAGVPSRDYSSLSIYINSPPDWKRAILG